ncbi:YbhB/YbcL family Raf kinase inhibitor-like protein [Salinisphaera sp. P385]|uniref:YbhB/YbcL family Raf kinase inhibitor-like protein n=1 Tax=Spectribacter acetivorans TaxID=3075603 RepID=A0ABU3BB60_9GAMM|nr:YbhB/YbcL family Raf kinase inhibitor-like protein [Salinisphaera sp. P385]MDT0619052.1 YbhB/YbcL family Raf kinase inhibitor-like protein [Salinisphaera sp. P385]
MQLTTTAFADGQPIPDHYAFAQPDADNHFRFSDNHNPDLAWSGVPDGTQSLVLLCIDPDAPSKPDDVNQEDREVPSDLPRVDFFHWVMVDLPADTGGIDAGACASEVTPGGKRQPAGPAGARQGLNTYTDWFAGDPDLGGHYYGYDGPAPPWNDSIPHRYEFRLIATDLPRCPVEGDFTGPELLAVLEDHVLATASVTGTYTLNPRLR